MKPATFNIGIFSSKVTHRCLQKTAAD